MKIDEYFFHQCVKVLFDFFKRFYKRQRLKEISVYLQHTVGVRGHALSGVACVLGMVKFTISAQRWYKFLSNNGAILDFQCQH